MDDDSGVSARWWIQSEYLERTPPVTVGDPDDDWREGWE